MILDPILKTALTQPQALATLNELDWDRLIQSARRLGLLARIQVLLVEGGLLEQVPAQPKAHLDSARIVADNEQRIMRWETNRIQRALGELSKPVVFLKGAAYLLAGLPVAKGRISTDVDILVDKADLGAVERALLEHGWEHTKADEYDQYYYRIWSHELPPLRHRERRTTIDVHHRILPPTGRHHPDPKKLLAAA
ncbi:MAG: nucleotidyltransferase domain-containing protein, partial [Candidatus Binatia bacterium]